MNSRRYLRNLVPIAALLAATSVGFGYVFMLDDTNCVSTWPAGTIPMQIKLATTPTLTDGSNYRSSVLAAMSEWNPLLGTVQLSGTGVAPGSYALGNGISEIVMDNNIGYGTDAEPFDQYTLAITIGYVASNFVDERDIIFNTAYQWDSFRGGQIGSKQDIRRVAAHELGHVLGLDHPDQVYPRQYGDFLMNSMVSYDPPIEVPQEDDIAGVQAIYGYPGFVPENDHFADAIDIVFSSFAMSFDGTNVAATGDAGEPQLDADEPGGRTVWWKWTADAGGTLTVNTADSNFDTLLGVYTGGAVDHLTQVGLNDDLDPGVIRWSRVVVDVEYGKTYYFAVDGFNGFVGTIKLNLEVVRDPARSPPQFIEFPSSKLRPEGEPLYVFGGVPNSPGTTFAWKKNGHVLGNQTGGVLNLASPSVSDSGHYEFVATNSIGSSTTRFDITVVPRGLALLIAGDTSSGQDQVPEVSGPMGTVSAGENHFAMLSAFGRGYVWGSNSAGQATAPYQFDGLVSVAAGAAHNIAIRQDGTLLAWGANPHDDKRWLQPWETPPSVFTAIAIDAGVDRNIALLPNGTVVSWGVASGVRAPNGLRNVMAIAAGGRHFLALKSDGTVVGWGESGSGEASPPAGLNGVVAIAAGGDANEGHSLALKSDGTVAAWGSDSSGQSTVPAGLTGVVAIAAGAKLSVALKSDGSLVIWGDQSGGDFSIATDLGEPFRVTAGGSTIGVSIRALPPTITTQPQNTTVDEGSQTALDVEVHGALPLHYQWKRYGFPLSNGGRVSGATSAHLRLNNTDITDEGIYSVEVSNPGGTVVSTSVELKLSEATTITQRPKTRVAAEGENVTFVVQADNSGGPLTYEWRHNRKTIPGATASTLNLGAVAADDAGYYEALVKNAAQQVTFSIFYLSVATDDVSVAEWGHTTFNTPAITWPIAAIEIGGPVVALRGDGTVVAWGDNNTGEGNVPAGLKNVAGVTAGAFCAIALKTDGTLVGWGGPYTPGKNLPPGLKDVVAVSAARDTAIALKRNGTVVTWGMPSESSGAFRVSVPAGLKNVVSVTATDRGYFAVRSNGTVVSWGEPGFEYLLPPGLTDVVSVSGKHNHFVAVNRNGTVREWGEDEPAPETPLSGIKSASAGWMHNLAVNQDGFVVAWGRNDEHPIEIPSGLGNVLAVAAGSNLSVAVYRNAAPSITAEPESRTAVVGDYITFASTAKGSLPLTYQWMKDGVDLVDGPGISGATTATLELDPVSETSGGVYDLAISNSRGTTLSAPANLVVKQPPHFVARPHTKLVAAGESVTFTADVTDPGPVSFKWRHNGNLIAGATGSSLSINPVGFADGGYYEVEASNPTAAVSSYFWLHVAAGPAQNWAVGGWGDNGYGGSSPSNNVPFIPGRVVKTALGSVYALALQDDGAIVGWGGAYNDTRPEPPGFGDAIDVFATTYESVVVLADGRAVPWGSYNPQWLTVPKGLRKIVKVVSDGGGRTIALHGDGTVSVWGMDPPPVNLLGVLDIAVSGAGGVALLSNHIVYTWDSGSEAFTSPRPDFTNVTAISAYGGHILALKANGTVVAWGRNDSGETSVPAGLANVVAISAGLRHNVVLKGDGSSVAWGANAHGGVGERPDLTPIAAVSSGYDYNLVLTGKRLPPSLTEQPVSVTVDRDAGAIFTAQVAGRPSPSVQWQKDGADVPGATSARLVIQNTQLLDAGDYRLKVTNPDGTIFSETVTLTVIDRVATPVFGPGYLTLIDGELISISTATPGASIRYAFDGGALDEQSGVLYDGPFTVHSSAWISAVAYKPGMETSYYQFHSVTIVPNLVPVAQAAALHRGLVGVNYTASMQATGGNGGYVWSLKSGALPSGLSFSSNGSISGVPSASGTFAFVLEVQDTDNVVALDDADTLVVAITIDPTDSVPTITTTSLPDAGLGLQYSQSLAGSGGNGTLTWSKASGSLPPGLSLSPNGVISGAPTSVGTFNFTVRVADDDTITGPADEATKELSITVIPAPRLINVSARTFAGSGGSTFIMGFVIEGTGQKTVVIRGVGPKLADFDVPLFVADPAIKLFKLDGTLVAENDDWTSTVAANTGGFSLPVGSKDAALEVNLPPGGYTVHLLNPGALAEAVIEVYDISHDAGTRLSNVSCRLDLPAGQIVIVGTVLAGGSRSIVVRNSGTGLAPYLLESERPLVAPDPVLNFHDAGGTMIGENDDWDASLGPYFNAIGAFPWPDGSKDAAARLTLTPGGYTVHATANGPGGIILIELYESP